MFYNGALMTFGKFAGYLTRLESLTSRNAMIEVVAELLKDLNSSEVDKAVYLMLGRLGPQYEKLEFQLADRMVIRAIHFIESGKTLQQVVDDFKEAGDLGNLVERYLLKRFDKETHDSWLSITEVFDELFRIMKEVGQGSQEKKIGRLASLLTTIDPLSSKYVIRIVLGKLRLGFSDKTILDALSWGEFGDKSGKDALETAYQVSPDIGLLAKLVKQYGLNKAVGKVDVALGTPVMSALASRLKTAEEMIAKMGRVIVEPKFDGTRVQIHFAQQSGFVISDKLQDTNKKAFFLRTFTRNLEETSQMFPELQEIGKQIKADSVILDSEAVGYDVKTGKLLPFQMTITRKRKHGVAEASVNVPLKFFVFDILYKDGKSLLKMPLSERRALLKKVVSVGNVLVIDDSIETDEADTLRNYHEKQLSEGLEGAMVKKVDGVYTPGRTGWSWVKFKESEEAAAKLSDTLDCVVMGYYAGQGKRTQFGLGAFLVGVRSEEGDKFYTIAKIGTGLSDEQWREIKERSVKYETPRKPKEYGEIKKLLLPDVWLEPAIVVEIAADEITKSPTHSAGVALRFPRLERFRDDKSPEQATTIQELERFV